MTSAAACCVFHDHRDRADGRPVALVLFSITRGQRDRECGRGHLGGKRAASRSTNGDRVAAHPPAPGRVRSGDRQCARKSRTPSRVSVRASAAPVSRAFRASRHRVFTPGPPPKKQPTIALGAGRRPSSRPLWPLRGDRRAAIATWRIDHHRSQRYVDEVAIASPASRGRYFFFLPEL